VFAVRAYLNRRSGFHESGKASGNGSERTNSNGNATDTPERRRTWDRDLSQTSNSLN